MESGYGRSGIWAEKKFFFMTDPGMAREVNMEGSKLDIAAEFMYLDG